MRVFHGASVEVSHTDNVKFFKVVLETCNGKWVMHMVMMAEGRVRGAGEGLACSP